MNNKNLTESIVIAAVILMGMCFIHILGNGSTKKPKTIEEVFEEGNPPREDASKYCYNVNGGDWK